MEEGTKKFASKGRNVPAGYRSTFKEERDFQANGRRGEKTSEGKEGERRQKALNDNGELASNAISSRLKINTQSSLDIRPTSDEAAVSTRAKSADAACSLSAPWKFIVGSAEPELARNLIGPSSVAID